MNLVEEIIESIMEHVGEDWETTFVNEDCDCSVYIHLHGDRFDSGIKLCDECRDYGNPEIAFLIDLLDRSRLDTIIEDSRN